jgi:hypothetical protein
MISQNVWVLGNLKCVMCSWSPWNPKNVHKRILEGFVPKQQLNVVMFMWLISLCKNPLKQICKLKDSSIVQCIDTKMKS